MRKGRVGEGCMRSLVFVSTGPYSLACLALQGPGEHWRRTPMAYM